MIDFNQFDCTDHVTTLRYITTSNGGKQYRHQCVKCGKQIGSTAIKFSSLTDEERQSATLFDYELQKEQYEERSKLYHAAQEAERTAQSIEWFKEHNEYLNSDVWKSKRLLVLQRDHHTCTANLSGCTHIAREVHHLTYAHWKNEPLFDLVSVCKHCHDQITSIDRANRNGPVIIW